MRSWPVDAAPVGLPTASLNDDAGACAGLGAPQLQRGEEDGAEGPMAARDGCARSQMLGCGVCPTCGVELGGAASCCSGASLSGWKVDPLKVCQLSAGSRCTAGTGAGSPPMSVARRPYLGLCMQQCSN